MKHAVLAALGATCLALCALGIASAHATLDHCTPAVSSTAATAPAQIVCVYSEEIDTKQSIMSVWDVNGSEVDKKDAHVDLNDPDHKTLIVSLDSTMVTNGLYTVKWHTVTPDDNGISDGSWQFVVGSANATPYPPTLIVQGETPGAASPSTPTAVGTPLPAASPTAAPAVTATPAAVATAEATVTTAAPSTAPSTGGPASSAWMLFALLAVVLVVGGVVVRARR